MEKELKKEKELKIQKEKIISNNNSSSSNNNNNNKNIGNMENVKRKKIELVETKHLSNGLHY
jgi:hypothetical protein